MPELTEDTNGNGNAIPIFESHPPAWLPKVHTSADLGYLGFHPPRVGQDEDLLSEANVKNGFVLGHQVSAETFSAHSIINGDLSSNATFSKLEALMNEIFVRRADGVPSIPLSTFRIPTRVTLNDLKRQAWFADLANPEVPLHKLGKSVPHGAKGHDLLDLLQSNNVAISRAVWFLRVFGANETAGLRNKPSYNPTQYSIDWANVVTSYMKKQLADIALPSAPRPGLNIKQTFKGVLSDGDTRERWISRFIYCLKLLRTFYSEGLVDNRTFLVWVVQQMGVCNLAQTGFITRLADEYLDGILGSRPLMRPFIDACLYKLAEIRSLSAQEFLHDTEALLKTLLQRLCLVLPDSFVSPRMWKAHSLLLADVFSESIAEQSGGVHVGRNSRDIGQVLQENLADIKRRNEAMLFLSLPIHVSARLASAVSDVKLLNSISSHTDIGNLQFFSHSTDDAASFIEKLDMLLTWCVTPLQYGDHRPFAAVTLIRNWRTQAGDRATRRDFNPPDEILQDRLFEWLDSSDVAREPDNIRAVSLLYGKLVKYELFSYASYIQRLIARGEAGLSFIENTESRHRKFLQWIPLSKSTSSLISQRKVALYGVRAREMPEEANERKIRREIRAVLPDVFGGHQTPTTSTASLLSSCNILMTSTRFEQVRTFRQWLLPILEKHIASQRADMNSMLLKTYSASVELMAQTECFHCILDLALSLLEHTTTLDLLIAVIDTLHRFATIWACMNAMGSIITALDKAHQVWKARGIQSRPLLSLLLEFDIGKHLNEASRDRITSDITVFRSALQPATDHPDVVPDVLPEILLLAGDPDADAPTLLANSLWIKYRKSVDWAWKVWDNTVASLRQVPVMTSDEAGRRACALRYGVFLWQVDQHLATGLDNEVLRWFLGPGKNEVAALSSEAWNVLTVVLLHLSVHGALKTTTILRGLVYPAWQQGASMPAGQQGSMTETFLRSANDICHRLLLSEDINDTLPPVDLLDLQCIRTRRQDVYCGPHFPLLASSIPLLICVENNEHISEGLRDDSMSLRHLISRHQDFRQGAYRNLDAIREAFEFSLQQLDEPNGTLGKHIVAGLRMVLCDISEELSDWPAVTCLLSPWKIAATMVQMQLVLKQMGQELVHDPTNLAAHADLDELILMLFHHSMTSEEAFYVGDMARGVDNIVAGKFINNGLRCITEIILESRSPIQKLSRGFQRAGELLRVLMYVAEPLREKSVLLPLVETSIQDEFIEALSSKLASMEEFATSNNGSETLEANLAQEMVLILRLLQFELGFRTIWSSKMKEATDKVVSSLFRLAMAYGTSVNPNLVIYPLMVDTLYYICDEIPADPKATPYDPFRNYPDASVCDLPSELPVEYRKQLASLLPLHTATASVSHMVNSHRDAAGDIVYGTPVVNRPWEWIENLGEPMALGPKEMDREREEKERLEDKYVVKNSGSLSLDTFGTRITGDGVLGKAGETEPRKESNLRSFEDGLSAETLFKRDWRETRVELEVDVMTVVSGGHPRGELDPNTGGAFYAGPRPEKRTTPRGSPSSSVMSRSSAHGSGSVRHSPQSATKHSNSTIGDVIDVDSITTVHSKRPLANKRKISTAITVSDDEIEIIEGPVARSNTNKRFKVKPSTKAKAKKK
ncbi:hypothetical protein D9615_002361 [Tricholomella constricta]|uniref:Mediator of RNA polymerase II transcription subunit 12 n=1 Tax=Tricholomella constricta TaxID=117010 RepID=A0A8H5HMM7_9AGAR|nr:hypothetical protein D9615_002361 [Tricholomella constricta]